MRGICYTDSDMKCDFHMHSTASDGMLSPAQVTERAFQRGLDAIALTDHDTVDGIPEAMERGRELGIKVLPGIEISCFDVTEVHILIFNLDHKNEKLAGRLLHVNSLRRNRNYLIAEKLAGLGIKVDIDQIYRDAGDKTVGRPDIADEMVKNGFAATRLEAFEEYLSVDKKAYVPAKRLTPMEAVELAHEFSGKAVLAHPKNLKMPQHAMADYLSQLVGQGLDGIEADYFSHTIFERQFYKSLADKHKLIVTGGSDFHDFTHGGEEVFYPNKLTRKILGLGE